MAVHSATIVVTWIVLFYSNLQSYQKIPMQQDDPWYTFFSSSLYHSTSIHLWTNMILFIPNGVHCEKKFGVVSSACVYWTSGALGAMIQTASLQYNERAYILFPSTAFVVSMFAMNIMHFVITKERNDVRKWVAPSVIYAILYIVVTNVDPVETEQSGAYLSKIVSFLCASVCSSLMTYPTRGPLGVIAKVSACVSLISAIFTVTFVAPRIQSALRSSPQIIH